MIEICRPFAFLIFFVEVAISSEKSMQVVVAFHHQHKDLVEPEMRRYICSFTSFESCLFLHLLCIFRFIFLYVCLKSYKKDAVIAATCSSWHGLVLWLFFSETGGRWWLQYCRVILMWKADFCSLWGVEDLASVDLQASSHFPSPSFKEIWFNREAIIHRIKNMPAYPFFTN